MKNKQNVLLAKIRRELNFVKPRFTHIGDSISIIPEPIKDYTSNKILLLGYFDACNWYIIDENKMVYCFNNQEHTIHFSQSISINLINSKIKSEKSNEFDFLELSSNNKTHSIYVEKGTWGTVTSVIKFLNSYKI